MLKKNKIIPLPTNIDTKGFYIKTKPLEEIDTIYERLNERIIQADYISEKIRRFSLGLDVCLDTFVEFVKPPMVNISAYLTFANNLSKMGYNCFEDWDALSEEIAKYVIIVNLLYMQHHSTPEERTFSALCELCAEAEEDFEGWSMCMLVGVPNKVMHYYLKELDTLERKVNGFDLLTETIEELSMYFLELNSCVDNMSIIHETIYESLEDFIMENNYDIFGLTEDEILSLTQEVDESLEITEDEIKNVLKDIEEDLPSNKNN